MRFFRTLRKRLISKKEIHMENATIFEWLLGVIIGVFGSTMLLIALKHILYYYF
jgi:hypothetical protein